MLLCIRVLFFFFFFVYCNDVLMQYCKVLGCNRTLLLAMMLYALYIALMLLCICVEPLVLALMLLCLCWCFDLVLVSESFPFNVARSTSLRFLFSFL